MNPAVTWTFWRLGKIQTMDAVFYTVFQFLGGWLGVAISALILGSAIADPSVAYIVTIPGSRGPAVAWGAEFGISLLLMTMILFTSNRPSLSSRTGIFAGFLIALYVLFEAPLSGMSMNPARTFGSAIQAGIYNHLWIYFTAPVIGMLAGAKLYKQFDHRVLCAKLVHDSRRPCIFCGHPGA